MDPTVIGPAIAFFVLVYSCILHEIMHAWTAWKLGDSTAKDLGRITLNPIPHIDIFSTILLPGFLYVMSKGTFYLGGAKPVPINPLNFTDPSRNMTPGKGYMISCIAGPLTNLGLAAASFIVIAVVCSAGKTDAIVSVEKNGISPVGFFLGHLLFINIGLAIFNLIPIPPLDGSRVLRYLLPPRGQDFLDRIEVFGLAIVILFIMGGGTRFIGEVYVSIVLTLAKVIGYNEAWTFVRHLFPGAT